MSVYNCTGNVLHIRRKTDVQHIPACGTTLRVIVKRVGRGTVRGIELTQVQAGTIPKLREFAETVRSGDVLIVSMLVGRTLLDSDELFELPSNVVICSPGPKILASDEHMGLTYWTST